MDREEISIEEAREFCRAVRRCFPRRHRLTLEGAPR